MKIYTKTGDDGTTGLQGNNRVSKDNPRIIAYGTIDEANATLGIALSYELDKDVAILCNLIQNELFIVGADLSNIDLHDEKNRVSDEMILNLEKNIDNYEKELSPLTNFILPGGNIIAAQIHHVRTIIRRAETCIVILSQQEKINQNCIKYVNRLSDLFFVLGRVLNKRSGQKDIIWKV
ncbi:MAG: cob(I)yrinic acid a,c-diamide adenosyltransferase [Nitrosarchaeum sp.]|nr:cob(I)yrinic acid a,c-diamide adenosyltransferase [Nitrosarchaeum sp.]PHY09093.1 MAG: ATP:cob(I)alamin adenosyltransferase [Nitrosarchaeum sp.]